MRWLVRGIVPRLPFLFAWRTTSKTHRNTEYGVLRTHSEPRGIGQWVEALPNSIWHQPD